MTEATALTDLLSATRAALVDLLRAGPTEATTLAEELGLAANGVRRHLAELERDGLVSSAPGTSAGPGRPPTTYRLTDRARRLYPDRSAHLARDALAWIDQRYGRSELLAFLRDRAGRQGSDYAEALERAGDDPTERAERLAELLTEDGFIAEVVPEDATTLRLHQTHCAVADIAKANPQICAQEAALFRRLLGTKVSRKTTIAAGADACICTISLEE